MKYNITKICYASCCLLLLCLAACTQSTEKKSVASKAIEPVAVSYREYYINNAQNEMLASISIGDAETVVKVGSKSYFGELKRADKRKYYDESDGLAYAVKYSDDGFKLRDSNEALLWKVKLYDDYIKLSDNEEMDNAYRVGLTSENKIKAKRGEEELGAIRLTENSHSITIGDAYLLANFGNSLASGVLLLEEVPEEQRFFICAELFSSGK